MTILLFLYFKSDSPNKVQTVYNIIIETTHALSLQPQHDVILTCSIIKHIALKGKYKNDD